MSLCLLGFVGYVTVAYAVAKLLRSLFNIIYPYLFAVPHNLQVLAGSRWAVVTGSTDGIGKAYAFELANKQFNIILISRNQFKLDEVAKEIRQKHSGVEIKTIAFDFTNGQLNDYEKTIFPILNEIEVGVLVNNVGLSYEFPERLDRIEGGLKRVTDITVINTVPTTLLSAFVLKQMAIRKNGVVINVASSAAYFPLFYWAIYSATKKYICWFSEILRKEYATTGLTIQTVCPMMVATKMSKIRKASFFTPTPKQFVREAVRSIGHTEETTGCLAHQLQAELLFNLPSFVFNKISIANSLQSRSRALKKKETASKQQ